jgi:hypothetical protein
MWWLCLIIASALVGCDAAPQPQRPAAAAAPLYSKCCCQATAATASLNRTPRAI